MSDERLQGYLLEVEAAAGVLSYKLTGKDQDETGREEQVWKMQQAYDGLRILLRDAAIQDALRSGGLFATALYSEVQAILSAASKFLYDWKSIRGDEAFIADWKRAIERVRQRVAELRDLRFLQPIPAVPAPPVQKGFALAPGGFSFGDNYHSLTGRPLEMLRVLVNSPHHAATADHLRKEMAIDDETVDFPEQVIRDTAKKLRDALRRAAKKQKNWNPIPSAGRGEEITYQLRLEEISPQ